jgi:hypothetical protein
MFSAISAISNIFHLLTFLPVKRGGNPSKRREKRTAKTFCIQSKNGLQRFAGTVIVKHMMHMYKILSIFD